MRFVNEGMLYSDQSKLSVAFYLRARSIRGRVQFEGAVYSRKYGNSYYPILRDVSIRFISLNKWRVKLLLYKYSTIL